MWLARGVPLQRSYQDEKTGSRSKCSLRCLLTLPGPQGFVEAADSARFGEIWLVILLHAGKRIKVSGEPAPIFREQAHYEFRWRFRTGPDQILPGRFRSDSARHAHAA